MRWVWSIQPGSAGVDRGRPHWALVCLWWWESAGRSSGCHEGWPLYDALAFPGLARPLTSSSTSSVPCSCSCSSSSSVRSCACSISCPGSAILKQKLHPSDGERREKRTPWLALPWKPFFESAPFLHPLVVRLRRLSISVRKTRAGGGREKNSEWSAECSQGIPSCRRTFALRAEVLSMTYSELIRRCESPPCANIPPCPFCHSRPSHLGRTCGVRC